MKARKSSAKVSQCKILGSQAEKLKDKLQTLKEQIRQKKQEKKMNTTATSLTSFNKQSKNNQKKQQKLNSTQRTLRQDKQLLELLSELKIENIVSKLQEKSIRKVQHLLSVDEEEIDKWKDIPIGYRIKLKKYIQKQKPKPKVPQLNVVQLKTQKKVAQIKDIEEIIKERKAGQIFIPIDRNLEELQQKEYVRQLEESQQEQMMRSLMLVLGSNNRKSCIKQSNFLKTKGKCLKQVHWSKSVDQMEKRHIQTKYPKEKINKQIFHEMSLITEVSSKEQLPISFQPMVNQPQKAQGQLPNYKYCWTCLKMLKQTKYSIQQRHFCSKNCLQVFQQQVNPTELFVQIIKVEEKYKELKQNPLSNQFQEEDQLSFDIL